MHPFFIVDDTCGSVTKLQYMHFDISTGTTTGDNTFGRYWHRRNHLTHASSDKTLFMSSNVNIYYPIVLHISLTVVYFVKHPM